MKHAGIRGGYLNIRRIPKKIMRRQEGQTLIIALIVFALGFTIITALLSTVSSGLIQGSAIENRTSQLYLADGGAEQSIFWIKNPTAVTVATLPAVINAYANPTGW